MADISTLISNNGFQYLAESIMQCLDPKSLANCRAVSRQWKCFIDRKKSLLMLQIHQTMLKRESKLCGLLSSDTNLFGLLSLDEIKPVLEDHKALLQAFKRKFKNDDIQEVLIFMKKHWARLPLTKNVFDFNEGIKQNVFAYACSNDHASIVKLFIEHSIVDKSVWIPNENDERSLIHLMCMNQCYNSLSVVLTGKAFENVDFTIRGDFGMTPLHVSCHDNDTKITDLLLQFGKLDVNAQCTDLNYTDLHYACRYGYNEIVKLILNHQKTTKIFNLNLQSSVGNTPLHLAIQRGHLNVAKEILNYAFYNKDDVDLNKVNDVGTSALHIACIEGYTEIVESLLMCGQIKNENGFKLSNINISIVNDFGFTPLNIARYLDHEDIVQIILKYQYPEE